MKEDDGDDLTKFYENYTEDWKFAVSARLCKRALHIFKEYKR